MSVIDEAVVTARAKLLAFPETMLAAVRAAARAHEPDRYLAALLAPEPERTALLAVAAFAGDLRRIPFAVHEPMLGEIRLQWWRDRIMAMAGEPDIAGAPIADVLAAAQRAYGLPKTMLLAMTEARAFDLYSDPMLDAAALAGYLTKTEAIPFELALRIADAAGPPPAEADAGGNAKTCLALGGAYGLARILAELPLWLSRGRMPIPLTALATAEVTLVALLSGIRAPGTDVLIGQLKRDALATCDTAAAQIGLWPKHRRRAALPLAMVRPYLAPIGTASHDPLRNPVELAPLRRVWRIVGAHLGRRF